MKKLHLVFAPLFVLAQCATVPLHAQTPGQGAQALEGGMLLPAGAPMTTTRPIALPDLRAVLQMQKLRPQEAPATQPERQLSAQQRTELRQQLRLQREHSRDNSRELLSN